MNRQISTNGSHQRFSHDPIEDEVESAKARLHALTLPTSRRLNNVARLVRKHPVASTATAAALGMVIARTPISKQAASIAAAWAVRNIVPRLLSKLL